MVAGPVRSVLPLLAGAFTAVCAAGCADGPILSLGSNGDDAHGVGVAGADAGPDVASGDADPAPPLAVQIEDDAGAVLDFVTLNCPGDCASLKAVASGGYAPYTFAWDDGTTDPVRKVCPVSTTTSVVAVTDQGVSSSDFSRPPETVQAPLVIEVLDCPDAGTDAPTTVPVCDSVAGDFSAMGINPRGPWSYGWSTTPGLSFTAFAHFIAVSDTASVDSDRADLAVWTIAVPDLLAGYRPDTFFNPGAMVLHPGGSMTVNPGQLGLQPSPSGQYSIVRWTAQEAGSYRVHFTFEGLSGYMGWPVTTSDVVVLHNNTDLAMGRINDGNDTANSVSGVANVDVLVGDFIDFAVGNGANGLGYGATALDAVVCIAK